MLVPIPVEEVATPEVETVGPDRSVREAARQLRAASVGSLLVVEDDDPVGILTQRDLVDAFALGTDPETAVSAVMTAPVATVETGTDVDAVADRFREESVGRFPVVEDGEVVGIVSTTDLSYYLPELARGPTPASIPEDRVRVDVRPETAYEREDWTFEYEAPADNVVDEVEVGDVARFSKTVGEDDVEAFADATGDTNRLHLDPEFAGATRFGRPIAHGVLTTGVVSAALARLPGLTIFLSMDLQFQGPIDVGDRVTAECRVVENLGDRKFRLSVTVETDAGPAVTGSTTVLIDDLPDVGPPRESPPGVDEETAGDGDEAGSDDE